MHCWPSRKGSTNSSLSKVIPLSLVMPHWCTVKFSQPIASRMFEALPPLSSPSALISLPGVPKWLQDFTVDWTALHSLTGTWGSYRIAILSILALTTRSTRRIHALWEAALLTWCTMTLREVSPFNSSLTASNVPSLKTITTIKRSHHATLRFFTREEYLVVLLLVLSLKLYTTFEI